MYCGKTLDFIFVLLWKHTIYNNVILASHHYHTIKPRKNKIESGETVVMNNMLAITYLPLIYDFIDSAVLSGDTSLLYIPSVIVQQLCQNIIVFHN
jgi:hypothetical protein